MNMHLEEKSATNIDIIAAAKILEQGHPDKCLNILHRLSNFSKIAWALKLAIAAAFQIERHNKVWQYYLLLMKIVEISQIKEKTLISVATAALQLSKFQEAEHIFKAIQRQKNGTNLPSLEETLLSSFGSVTKMDSWLAKIEKEKTELSMTDSIRYASVLMHKSQYDKAFQYLHTVKEGLAR